MLSEPGPFTISTRRKPEEDPHMGTCPSEPQLDRNALAALYEETFKNLEEGTITEGRVVALTKERWSSISATSRRA